MSLTPLAIPGRARLPLNAARTSCSARRDRQRARRCPRSRPSPSPERKSLATRALPLPVFTKRSCELRAPNLDTPGRSTGPLTPNKPIGPSSGKRSDNFSINPGPDLFPPPRIWTRRSDAVAESACYTYSKRYYIHVPTKSTHSPIRSSETYCKGRYCYACKAIYLCASNKDNPEHA